MTLDSRLRSAVEDTQNRISGIRPPPIHSRSRWIPAASWVAATAALVAVVLVVVWPRPGGEAAVQDDDTLITSEMILEDGVVTQEEYRAGALAVVVCYSEAGIEAEVDFDNPNGSASFYFPRASITDLDANEACSELHLSQNVSFGWAAASGRLDLEELRLEDTAVTACVEERSGEDFGDLIYDEFSYLTEQGQETRDAAFEYEDHQPWGRCRNDLGFEEEEKAEMRTLLECVETRTGEDFGELEFDDTGHPTEASQQTLNLAYHYQDDEVWEACRTEFGFPNRTFTSDN